MALKYLPIVLLTLTSSFSFAETLIRTTTTDGKRISTPTEPLCPVGQQIVVVTEKSGIQTSTCQPLVKSPVVSPEPIPVESSAEVICKDLAMKYYTVPNLTWGQNTYQEDQTKWEQNFCNPIVESDKNLMCINLDTMYNVTPGISWGKANNDGDAQNLWKKNSCDDIVLDNKSAVCTNLKQIYNIIPNSSWGSSEGDEAVERLYRNFDCDNK